MLCILTVCLCMATMTEVFPCFFLSCKANARVIRAKTGHDPHSSKFLCCLMHFLCCSMYCFASFIVCMYMCNLLLPPGDNPIAVNKYIILHISYIISYINIRRISAATDILMLAEGVRADFKISKNKYKVVCQVTPQARDIPYMLTLCTTCILKRSS
jgi:hypothetical protein